MIYIYTAPSTMARWARTSTRWMTVSPGKCFAITLPGIFQPIQRLQFLSFNFIEESKGSFWFLLVDPDEDWSSLNFTDLNHAGHPSRTFVCLLLSCWREEVKKKKGSFQLLNPLVVLNSNQVHLSLPARNAKRRKAAESKENWDWEDGREYESSTRWVYLVDLLLFCVCRSSGSRLRFFEYYYCFLFRNYLANVFWEQLPAYRLVITSYLLFLNKFCCSEPNLQDAKSFWTPQAMVWVNGSSWCAVPLGFKSYLHGVEWPLKSCGFLSAT